MGNVWFDSEVKVGRKTIPVKVEGNFEPFQSFDYDPGMTEVVFVYGPGRRIIPFDMLKRTTVRQLEEQVAECGRYDMKAERDYY